MNPTSFSIKYCALCKLIQTKLKAMYVFIYKLYVEEFVKLLHFSMYLYVCKV